MQHYHRHLPGFRSLDNALLETRRKRVSYDDRMQCASIDSTDGTCTGPRNNHFVARAGKHKISNS